MKSIKIPFQFDGGRVASVSTSDAVARQKIVDVLTTGAFERVMRHRYGTRTNSLLFEPIDDLEFADFKVDAIQTMNEVLSRVQILDLQIANTNPQNYFGSDSTTVTINVVYRLPLGAPQLVQVNVAVPGNVTEDSPI